MSKRVFQEEIKQKSKTVFWPLTEKSQVKYVLAKFHNIGMEL